MAGNGRRYTEAQIIAILKEAETAPTVGEVIRRHGVAPKTYYRWKAKFAGMDVSVQVRHFPDTRPSTER